MSRNPSPQKPLSKSRTLKGFQQDRKLKLARLRIDGLPDSEVARKLNDMENLRESLTDKERKDGRDIQILHEEVSLLALELGRIQNGENATKIQADKYQDFMKTAGDPAIFQRWLSQHFQGAFIEMAERRLPDENGGYRPMRFFEMAQSLLERAEGYR